MLHFWSGPRAQWMTACLLNSYIKQIVILLFPRMQGTAEFDEQTRSMVASEKSSVAAKQAFCERQLLLLIRHTMLRM